MAVSVSKAGPYYASGSISFSSLRANFKEMTSGSIRASELIRNTSTSATNPTVPDATENVNIASSAANLKLSQFRNSIKYYYLTQSGINDNSSATGSPGLNISAQSWNNNLNKNIRKWFYLQGIIGSVVTSQYAASFDAEAYNLTLDVSGYVYGQGGTGGTLASISGNNAGSAMYLRSTGSSIAVKVNAGARIYAGGGGGEKGATGANGSSGLCYTTTDYTTGGNCGSCPGCGSNTSLGCRGVGGCNCGKGGCGSTVYVNDCRSYSYFSVPGGTGGEGGNGGNGQGYTIARTNGSTGSAGGYSSCGSANTSTQTQGATGETGGNGGDWGASGGNTTNTGNGGSPGRAISGSNYLTTGTLDLTTIKGLYQP